MTFQSRLWLLWAHRVPHSSLMWHPTLTARWPAADMNHELSNNEMELTRSAMARRRGPRSSSQCSTDHEWRDPAVSSLRLALG